MSLKEVSVEKKIDLEWLKKQTILNIISARGVIFTYYKNKQQQEREKKCYHLET